MVITTVALAKNREKMPSHIFVAAAAAGGKHIKREIAGQNDFLLLLFCRKLKHSSFYGVAFCFTICYFCCSYEWMDMYNTVFWVVQIAPLKSVFMCKSLCVCVFVCVCRFVYGLFGKICAHTHVWISSWYVYKFSARSIHTPNIVA